METALLFSCVLLVITGVISPGTLILALLMLSVVFGLIFGNGGGKRK